MQIKKVGYKPTFIISFCVDINGAAEGNRTPTMFPSADFESAASASSATAACFYQLTNLIITYKNITVNTIFNRK